MIRTPDGKDFLPTAHIHQGTMWPVLPAECLAGHILGCRQREFEQLIGTFYNEQDNNIKHIDRLANARIKALSKMGFIADCCLTSLTLYPFLTVNDVEGEDASITTTVADSTQIRENVYLPGNSNIVPYEFLPKTRGKWGFDTNNYCMLLNQVVTGNSQLGFATAAGEASYPLFANLAVMKTEPYPTIKPGITPPFYYGDMDDFKL